MPTSTFVALATTTLGSAASSVTFSSIPATYRDLVLVSNVANTTAAFNIRAQFNGDGGSNYSYVGMYATASTSGSLTAALLGDTALTTPELNISYIMDYSATDKHKTILSRANLQAYNVQAWASRWANTNAITSIYIFPNNGQWASGSSFSLYGIEA